MSNNFKDNRPNRFWNCFHAQYGKMVWWGENDEK